MLSAIILASLLSIFYAITKGWGAWYALSGQGQDRKSTIMPILLAGPRFILTVGGLLIGMKGLDWDASAAMAYVIMCMGAFFLVTTAEIMYVQTVLRQKKYTRNVKSSV